MRTRSIILVGVVLLSGLVANRAVASSAAEVVPVDGAHGVWSTPCWYFHQSGPSVGVIIVIDNHGGRPLVRGGGGGPAFGGWGEC